MSARHTYKFLSHNVILHIYVTGYDLEKSFIFDKIELQATCTFRYMCKRILYGCE